MPLEVNVCEGMVLNQVLFRVAKAVSGGLARADVIILVPTALIPPHGRKLYLEDDASYASPPTARHLTISCSASYILPP